MSKRTVLVGLFLGATLVLLGQQQAKRETGRLRVVVINPGDGLSLTNAQVFIHRMNAETMTRLVSTGRGEFSSELEQGYYDVVVTDATSIPWAKAIEIQPNTTVFLKAEMIPDQEHLQE